MKRARAMLRLLSLPFFAIIFSQQLCAQEASAPSSSEGESVAVESDHAPSATVLRSVVRRVLMDVTVFDKDAKPVPELKRDDFLLYEDGQLREIRSLSETRAPKAEELTPQYTPPQGFFTNATRTPITAPITVIYLDLLHMDMKEQMRALQQAKLFVRAAPVGSKLVLFTLKDEFRMLQGVTGDKALLQARLNSQLAWPYFTKFRPDVESDYLRMARLTQDGWAQMARYLASMPERKNVLWLAVNFTGEASRSMQSLFGASSGATMRGQQTGMGESEGSLKVASVKSVASATRSAIDNAIIKSGAQTINELAISKVALYPINVQGLSAPGEADLPGQEAKLSWGVGHMSAAMQAQVDEGGQQIDSASSGKMKYDAEGDFEQADHMTEVAEQTGGRSLGVSNRPALAMMQAQREGSNFYTLSYEPLPLAAGSEPVARQVRIRVRRKDVELHYRRSYLASDASAEPAAAVLTDYQKQTQFGMEPAHEVVIFAKLTPTDAPRMATPEEMRRLESFQAERGALEDKMALYYHQLERCRRKKNCAPIEEPHLPPVELAPHQLEIRLPLEPLQLQAVNGVRQLTLEYIVHVFDGEGKKLTGGEARLAIRFTDAQYEALKAKGYTMRQTIDLPPGSEVLRLTLRDAASGKVGSIELPAAPKPNATPASK